MAKDPKDKIPVLDLFFALLNWCNLLDRSKKLSITNLAVLICVAKMAIAPQVSLVDAGMLLISLLNYGHKRSEGNKAAKEERKELVVSAIQEQIDSMQSKIEDTVKLNETTLKQAEEVAKIVRNNGLGKLVGGK